MSEAYRAYYLCGRLRGDGDHPGTVYHAVEGDASYSMVKALCGKGPGRLSAGWGSRPEPIDAVTCSRCASKLRRLDGDSSKRAGPPSGEPDNKGGEP